MNKPLIEVKNLKKYFSAGRNVLKAVDDVSFSIYEGETLGLVGESGCGKSTIGRTMLGLFSPTSGSISFNQKNILDRSKETRRYMQRQMQMIFQDPYSSLNPRMTARSIISEPFEIHKIFSKEERKEKVLQLLRLVGLSAEHVDRFPHEFSGGQRQRIGIARALAIDPKFIICDEPIAALDVSIGAQIINLLKKLQQEMGLTYLFISHDLSIVKYLSTRVAVMYLGHIVEMAPTEILFKSPKHPYTRALLSSIPLPDPALERARIKKTLTGEVPSPVNPPLGCPFCTRCPKVLTNCAVEKPLLTEVAPDHYVACHL